MKLYIYSPQSFKTITFSYSIAHRLCTFQIFVSKSYQQKNFRRINFTLDPQLQENWIKIILIDRFSIGYFFKVWGLISRIWNYRLRIHLSTCSIFSVEFYISYKGSKWELTSKRKPALTRPGRAAVVNRLYREGAIYCRNYSALHARTETDNYIFLPVWPWAVPSTHRSRIRGMYPCHVHFASLTDPRSVML